MRHPWLRVLACAAAACLALAQYPSARADTVLLLGSMRTTADLTDRYVVHVPEQVPSMILRIPIPDAAQSPDPLSGSVNVGDFTLSSSVDPDENKIARDDAGNLYRVLVYREPKPGDITVEAKFDRVDVSTDLSRPVPETRLPLRLVPPEVELYLQPTALVQSDLPYMHALAAKVTTGSSTESEAATMIGLWLQNYLKYGPSPDGKTDAISTLRERQAVCEGWSHAFIALARARGIPARFVGGYCLGGTVAYPLDASGQNTVLYTSGMLPHAWVELWYPKAGWIPYDPQGSAGFVDSHHLRVWAAVDANGNLPLLTWNVVHLTLPFSFAEKESANILTDDISVRFAGELTGPAKPVLFSRDVTE